MTRQWRWGLIGVAVLAGLVAGAVPVVNGWQTQKTWQATIEALDTQLAAATGGEAGAQVVAYERGLYSARTTTRLVLPAASLARDSRRELALPPGPPELVLEQVIRHGFRGVRFSGHLEPRGPLAVPYARLGGNAETLQISGHIRPGSQALAVQTQALEGPLDPDGALQLRIEPLQLETRYRDGSSRLETRLEWPGLVMTAPETEGTLRVGRMSAESDARLVAGTLAEGVWVGEGRYSLEALALTPALEPGIALEQFTLTAASREREDGLIAGTLNSDWARLVLPDTPPLRGALEVRFDRLAPAGLLALSRQSGATDLNGLAGAGQRRALALLAEAAPRLDLSRLRVETEANAGLNGSMELAVRPAMADRLRTGQAGMALWSAVRLDAEMGLDETLARALPAEQAAWLRQLEGFGIVERREGQWRLAVSLTDGQLSVHGRPWWGGGGAR